MNVSISRRVAASVLALVATAAVGLGGSTEAWGSAATTHGHTSASELRHPGSTVSVATSAWEARPAYSKTSAWE